MQQMWMSQFLLFIIRVWQILCGLVLYFSCRKLGDSSLRWWWHTGCTSSSRTLYKPRVPVGNHWITVYSWVVVATIFSEMFCACFPHFASWRSRFPRDFLERVRGLSHKSPALASLPASLWFRLFSQEVLYLLLILWLEFFVTKLLFLVKKSLPRNSAWIPHCMLSWPRGLVSTCNNSAISVLPKF